jgi:hypothetical protein
MDIEKCKEVIKQIDDVRAGGLTIAQASEKLGLEGTIYYRAKNILEGKPKRIGPVEQMKTSVFEVAKAEDAKVWVTAHRSGRFMEMKEQLLTQVRTLRKTEALHFPVDANNKKEVNAIVSACANALRKADLPWAVRFSALKKSVVILHQDTLAKRQQKEVPNGVV